MPKTSLGRRSITTANLAAARMLFDPLWTDGTLTGLPKRAQRALVQAQGGTIRWTDDNLSGIVSNVTSGAAGVCRITSKGHGLTTNDQVIVFGLLGATAANGTASVTVIDADTFDLQGTTYAAAPSTGSITAVAASNAGLYRLTSSSHGVTTGKLIAISGVVTSDGVSFGPEANPNGLWLAKLADTDNLDLLETRAIAACKDTGGTWTSQGFWYATANLPTATKGQRMADGDSIEFTGSLRKLAFIQETTSGAATVNYYSEHFDRVGVLA